MMKLLPVILLSTIAAWSQSTQVLTQAEIEQLETKVAQNPKDLPAQALLGQNYAFFILGITGLGTYDLPSAVDPARSDSEFAQHAWKVLTGPALPNILGEAAAALWKYSTAASSYEVLHHQPDRQTLYQRARQAAIEALDRAVTLDPDNTQWRSYRIPIIAFRSNFKQVMPLTAAAAYALAKEDMALLPNRMDMVQYVAMLAIRAGALEDAQHLARQLLENAGDPRGWNHGNALFAGNTILGQVALRQKDPTTASAHLLAAGKTPGSPQLNSFGPNMSLARDLLKAGERQPVLEFFEECRTFWKSDRGRLQQWADQVKAGQTPDFGANLLY